MAIAPIGEKFAREEISWLKLKMILTAAVTDMKINKTAVRGLNFVTFI